eukprot:COSAG02_NODE_15600_length_1157_cov_1.013233_1_plen_64_part_00
MRMVKVAKGVLSSAPANKGKQLIACGLLHRVHNVYIQSSAMRAQEKLHCLVISGLNCGNARRL